MAKNSSSPELLPSSGKMQEEIEKIVLSVIKSVCDGEMPFLLQCRTISTDKDLKKLQEIHNLLNINPIPASNSTSTAPQNPPDIPMEIEQSQVIRENEFIPTFTTPLASQSQGIGNQKIGNSQQNSCSQLGILISQTNQILCQSPQQNRTLPLRPINLNSQASQEQSFSQSGRNSQVVIQKKSQNLHQTISQNPFSQNQNSQNLFSQDVDSQNLFQDDLENQDSQKKTPRVHQNSQESQIGHQNSQSLLSQNPRVQQNFQNSQSLFLKKNPPQLQQNSQDSQIGQSQSLLSQSQAISKSQPLLPTKRAHGSLNFIPMKNRYQNSQISQNSQTQRPDPLPLPKAIEVVDLTQEQDQEEDLPVVPKKAATFRVKFTKVFRRKFTLQMHLMAKIHVMMQTGQISTIRDLYYENFVFYQNQGRLSNGLFDLCHILKVPRDAFRIEVTSKGLVAGNLSFKSEKGERVDVENFRTGMLIPSFVDDLQELRTTAKYILVVEKDAIFQRLIAEKVFVELGPIILITGKGYPDYATRKLIRRLVDNFQLQVFGLVDCDPHGIEIAAIYRWGSYGQWSIANCAENFSLTNNMTIPNLLWIGLLPSELLELSLPETSSAAMTEKDKRKIKAVKQRIETQGDPAWTFEVDTLVNMEVKAELEALFMHPKFAIFFIKQKVQTHFKTLNMGENSQTQSQTFTNL